MSSRVPSLSVSRDSPKRDCDDSYGNGDGRVSFLSTAFASRRSASYREGVSRRHGRHGAALRAGVGRGAQVVAAGGARTRTTRARTDAAADAQGGKDREQQGERPVGKRDRTKHESDAVEGKKPEAEKPAE